MTLSLDDRELDVLKPFKEKHGLYWIFDPEPQVLDTLEHLREKGLVDQEEWEEGGWRLTPEGLGALGIPNSFDLFHY